MLQFLKRLFSREARLRARWERRLKSIPISHMAPCAVCDNPIMPGDFVGRHFISVGLDPIPKLIHAGFHETATNEKAFCETAAVGIGYWDGEKIVGRREPLAVKAMRTGEAQSETY